MTCPPPHGVNDLISGHRCIPTLLFPLSFTCLSVLTCVHPLASSLLCPYVWVWRREREGEWDLGKQQRKKREADEGVIKKTALINYYNWCTTCYIWLLFFFRFLCHSNCWIHYRTTTLYCIMEKIYKYCDMKRKRAPTTSGWLLYNLNCISVPPDLHLCSSALLCSPCQRS